MATGGQKLIWFTELFVQVHPITLNSGLERLRESTHASWAVRCSSSRNYSKPLPRYKVSYQSYPWPKSWQVLFVLLYYGLTIKCLTKIQHLSKVCPTHVHVQYLSFNFCLEIMRLSTLGPIIVQITNLSRFCPHNSLPRVGYGRAVGRGPWPTYDQ